MKKDAPPGSLGWRVSTGLCLILLILLKLAPKLKDTKPKGENADPNVHKGAKPKEGGKKTKKEGRHD